MPAGKGRPLWNRRRVRGITPHSQTGKIKPIKAPVIAAGTGRFDMKRAMRSRSRKTSTKPEMSVPNKRYGTASINIPKKIVAKRFSLETRLRNRLHGTILAKTMTSTNNNTNQITVRDARRDVVADVTTYLIPIAYDLFFIALF